MPGGAGTGRVGAGEWVTLAGGELSLRWRVWKTDWGVVEANGWCCWLERGLCSWGGQWPIGVCRGTGQCGHLDRAVLWQLSGTAGPTSHFPRLPLGGLVWMCHSHHWQMGTDPEGKDGV